MWGQKNQLFSSLRICNKNKKSDFWINNWSRHINHLLAGDREDDIELLFITLHKITKCRFNPYFIWLEKGVNNTKYQSHRSVLSGRNLACLEEFGEKQSSRAQRIHSWVFFLSNTGSFSKTTFNVCLRNFENGKLNASVKENFICLIPKREDAVMVKDYRPISLTSLTYKIMAKVLVERLKRIMQTIIAPSQSALIEGR